MSSSWQNNSDPLGQFALPVPPSPSLDTFPFQKPLEESRSPFTTTLGGLFLQLLGLIFLSYPPSPPLLHAPCPGHSLATGNRSRKEPVDTRGGNKPIQSFPFAPSVPPHIYAFTFIFCYRCIHYSKGNVSCFTSIKLYKLEAWPPFVPQRGERAQVCPSLSQSSAFPENSLLKPPSAQV